MGLTRRQTFLQVELPLALPAIIAGLRIATVVDDLDRDRRGFRDPRRPRQPDLRPPSERRTSSRRSSSPPAGWRSCSRCSPTRCSGARAARAHAVEPGRDDASTVQPDVRRCVPLHRRPRSPAARQGARDLELAFTALGIALVLALPLGLWLGHRHRGLFFALERLERRPRAAERRAHRVRPHDPRRRLLEQHRGARRARDPADPDERVLRGRRRRPRRRRGGAGDGADRDDRSSRAWSCRSAFRF